MARVKFTAGRIRDFLCPEGRAQAFLWDADAPGLAVRATTGAKVFVFQSKLNGKDIRLKIGDTRAWGIDAARDEARRLLTLMNQGIDPRDERQERVVANEAKRKDAARQQATVGDAWLVYLDARRAKWGERHLLNHMNMAKAGGEKRTRGRRKGESETTQPGPLHSLLSIRLADLDGDAVKAWLEPLAARTPTQAAQTYRALRAFLTWCTDRPEYRSIAHADACNRRMARDTLPKARAKDDCLQREQLPAWFEQVGKIGNPVIAAYLQALLLTGARREELAGLKWEDVDFQWKSITIHDKVEGERTIPLTPYVASLLAPLPRRTVIRDGEPVSLPWVFSSPTAASGRLQEPRIQHVKALDAAGLPHVSLHGLRRSFGTLAEWVECPAGISAQIMGHKPSAIAEKHYRRRPLDLLRQWHTKIEGWILEQAGIEQPSEELSRGLRAVQ
ncbi:integrase family protein [Aromatoleum toluclasticum]|uniref:tyrosine-type recombinase/integrase n=1 Tax=Aromatoleum toluclasticum TaxID=92003 RepID=UPI001D18F8B2|nr:integrase family protein [Aromatoleum toluclasticum]MCC4117646.1 integrase family protein [Aromatoleum toluclasticum]